MKGAFVDGGVGPVDGPAVWLRMIGTPEIAARVIAAFRQDGSLVDEKAIVEALRRFNDLWNALFPAEQARIVRLLVNRDTVGLAGRTVDLRDNGLAALVRNLSRDAHQEAAE